MTRGVDETEAHRKADFSNLYDQPDPRAYYRGLGRLDYEVPHHGRQFFDGALRGLDRDEPVVVDLCCSYGVNAALLKHDVELDELYAHYCADEISSLPTERLADVDRAYYADRRSDARLRVIGLDCSTPAVDYAVCVGLLDAGDSEDLEVADPSTALGTDLASADLVTVTGGVGYITERTFDRIMACASADEAPWVASLCLRNVPYEPIADCLEGFGLVTEQLPEITFPQRRFESDAERDFVLAGLHELDVDPRGREAEGRYHVNAYLSRPAASVRERSITDLFRFNPSSAERAPDGPVGSARP